MARNTAKAEWRVAWLFALLTLFLLPSAIAQEIGPSSDILVPWFEVDLAHPDDGLNTRFTIVNASPKPIVVQATVYTNWGIPVLTCEHEVEAAESHSCDLEKWIVEGQIVDKLLTPAEIVDVQAKLSGKPSPVDHLYYATEVRPDFATGYVIFSTKGGARPDTLWGDVITTNEATNQFQGDTLVHVTHDLKGECSRHGIRFDNGAELAATTEIVIWTGHRFDPSPTPEPIGDKVKVTLSVYDMAGNHVQDCYRSITAVQLIELCQLEITPKIGWLDIKTAEPSYVAEHLNSVTTSAAEVHAWCFPEDLGLEGPAIRIKKFVAGNDADEPGDAVDIPIGDTVAYTFRVTNTGAMPLTSITVTDSTGIQVTCPRTELNPGEAMTCTAHTTAIPCLQPNHATVYALDPGGDFVTDKDSAFYFGLYDASVSIEKRVNGDDADEPPGPRIKTGDSVQWSYIVTNTGAADLHGIKVSDTRVPHVSCPKGELVPGDSMTCTAETKADFGQQDNVATASAYPPCGDAVEASDPAHYFGYEEKPAISIAKLVNGNDANEAPGPSFAVGSQLVWTFLVTNTGDVTLSDILVNDNKGIQVTCPKTTLDPGESMTCTAPASAALPCAQTNRASASGKPEKGGRVSDDDDVYYTGTPVPSLSLEARVNGNDADTPPGPTFNANDALTFTYVVTNTGDIELTGVTLTATDDIDFTPVCPKTVLAAGESMTCTASAIAHAGSHEHQASVTGTPACGEPPYANDPAYYTVVAGEASVDIEKYIVHGEGIEDDADTSPGPTIGAQEPVQWKFVVTNNGNVLLTNFTITDDQLGPLPFTATSLAPGASMTLNMSDQAQTPCTHHNVVTVTALAEAIEPGFTVTDSDPAYFYREPLAQIGFEKLTNGYEADDPTGPVVRVGDTVVWTYVVTNTSNVTMTGVTVTDDRGVAVSCPKTALEPGESMTCTASGLATRGQYRNTGSVTAQLPCGPAVTANDPSHYYGALPLISLEKLVAGEDADTPPGPSLLTGDPVLFSYVVTNTGDVELTNVHVNDDHGLTVTCPKTTLAVAESMTCTATSTVAQGAYANLGTAYGDALGTTVSATDPAHYTGSVAAVTIVKSTNGNDANTPPGPNITQGQTVQWTYVVTNTGTVALTNVVVTDDKGVTVTCPKTALEPGESMTCTASGTAIAGQYANVGTVVGTPPSGPNVTASDPSHYFGVEVGDQGCTPGYWKNHTDSWPPTTYTPSQSVVSVFGNASPWTSLANATLLDALSFAGGPGVDGAAEILLRAAVAALLNASHSSVTYPRTTGSVLTDVNAALGTADRDTMLALAAALDADNNLGCPLN